MVCNNGAATIVEASPRPSAENIHRNNRQNLTMSEEHGEDSEVIAKIKRNWLVAEEFEDLNHRPSGYEPSTLSLIWRNFNLVFGSKNVV